MAWSATEGGSARWMQCRYSGLGWRVSSRKCSTRMRSRFARRKCIPFRVTPGRHFRYAGGFPFALESLCALCSLSRRPRQRATIRCRPAGRCAAEMAATEGAPCVTIKIAQQAAQQTFSSFDANAVHMYLARWPALRRSLLLRSAALFSFPLCPVPFGTFADS